MIPIRLYYTTRKHLLNTRLWGLGMFFLVHGGKTSVFFWNLDTHPSSSTLNPSQKWDLPLGFTIRDTLAYGEPRNTCLWKQMDEKAFQWALGKKPTHYFRQHKENLYFYIEPVRVLPGIRGSFPPDHGLCISFAAGFLLSHLILQLNWIFFLWQPFPLFCSCFSWASVFPRTIGLVEMPDVTLEFSEADAHQCVPAEFWPGSFISLMNLYLFQAG